MDNQGRGLIKALETWAKNITKGYRDVNVRDMSASFRDGLAFCAIIHHYRPDLIDFDALSKENILENNQMAFSVAEKQLGVPALLDAEDMVQFSRPDRLSIITYLSQLHNCFENQNKMRSGFKRLQKNNISTRPSKVIAAEPSLTTRRIEVCQVCNNRVFILERLIVDNKLYHTACFRCYKCDALLNPGAYIESDTPGKYECTVCLPEDKMSSMETDDTESHSSLEEKCDVSTNSVSEPLRSVQSNVITKSPLSESVTQARVSFLQHSLSKSDGTHSNPNFSISNKIPSVIDKELPRNGVSVKDKISVFESSKVSKLDSPQSLEQTSPIKLRESPTSKSSSYLNTTLSKSPQPSVRLSKLPTVTPDENEKTNKNCSEDKTYLKSTEVVDAISKLPTVTPVENEKTTEKCFEDKTLLNSTEVDTINPVCSSNEKEALEDLPADLDESETKSDCDIFPSNEVPASDPVTSSITENVSPLKTFRKDLDKSNVTYKSSIGEYKSPLKSSHDIFQTNIQPLKLIIPTINSSAKSESSSLPGTPLSSSSEHIKSHEIAQIRSSYNKSLTRPLSSSNLQIKLKSEEMSESKSSDMLPNEGGETTVRSKSLIFDKNSELKNNSKIESDESKDPFSTTNEQKNSTIETVSSTIPKRSPIPSIRHSLGPKPLDLPSKVSREKAEPSSLRSTVAHKKVEEKTVKKDTPVKPSVSKEQEEKYPDDLNPFGDDGENEEEEYPDDLNPFGDDEIKEEKPPKVFEGVCADNYDESKNPFASDEEEAETSFAASTPSPRKFRSENNSPFGTISSPTGSLRGTTKKRKAPQPPKMSDIFPNTESPDGSLKPSPSVSRRGLETPSPKLRKNKPAPPPPTPSPRQNSQNGVSPSGKQPKEDDAKSDSAAKEPKRRKRPAPPVPIPMRKDKKKIPLKEILREMKEIEAKQRELETQGRQIELLIRDRDKDEEPSVEEEENIMQLFDLVNQKNALFRRQAELMYIKRSQRLEEQQEELEKQIRELMAKPESDKTEEEKAREEELIYELTDIVDQRNSIIDSIEMDRRREMEEDVSVQEHIEIKNGDLPIAAELKEKSKGKDKKEKKEKKEKKKKDKKKKEKNQENGDTGKNTLKRKLFK